MNTVSISAEMYLNMVRSGAANLNKNRTIVNELNVFPVPDGDTGDNMFLTIRSGSEAADKESCASLSDMASRIATGMLLGARGNSGVILSRIFSGIAKGLTGSESATVKIMGRAFEDSIEEAYGAVSKPVEGTILSVYRDAVRFANGCITEESTIDRYFDDFIQELKASLQRTPELLAVLKEAGVVDSGAAGLLYIAEGMKKALDGEAVEETLFENGAAAHQAISFDAFTEDSELTYGYCTEFLLRLQNKKKDAGFDIDDLTSYLNSVGNSVVSFQEGSIVKVHVHTMNPGVVLNHCQQYGEFLTLKIENMNLQHNETVGHTEQEETVISTKKHKKYGVVTVANGEGLKQFFTDLGADEVIEGGQSMNPSAEDFLRAFKAVNADHILVFPNNSNIVATAKQAKELSHGTPVSVIETRNIGEGYTAIAMLDTTLETAEEVEKEAQETILSTVTGMVSKANRNSQMNGVCVSEGDFIGFTDKEILFDSPDRMTASIETAKKLDAGDHDILILIRGKDAPEEEAAELKKRLEKLFPDTEAVVVNGLQPIYDYIMILE